MDVAEQPAPKQPVDVRVVFHPLALTAHDLLGRCVVVFDVLRATTTIAAALAAGVKSVRIFGDIDSAAQAANACGDASRLLCGEVRCLPPPGFDLGNSPGAFDRSRHAGRTVFLSTTNGTRAIIAAREGGAAAIFTGALINASAVAAQLLQAGRDVTLLCAGTGAEPAMEDILGAGAVLDALKSANGAMPSNDSARIAQRLFAAAKDDLPQALAESQGGRNLLAVGLEADIAFCANLDAIGVVGEVYDSPLRVARTQRCRSPLAINCP